MCGIVYNHNFDGSSASNRVLKQFKRQIRRGTTSFGFALPDKHINNWKIKYEDIAHALRRTRNPEILFHHRLSTSTADRPTSCHPFSTKDTFANEFVGVHNGMLSNEHDLYELHKERFKGLRYVSDNGKDFNDSEAYIYDLASYFSGMNDGIEMRGYGAFIVIEYDKETHERLKLHWGTTNTSSAPLRVHHNQKHLDITSEGKGWLVKEDVHYVYDYASGDITSSPLVHTPAPLGFSPYSYDYDYYDSKSYQPSRPYASSYDGFGSYSTQMSKPTSVMSDSIDGDSDYVPFEDEQVISELNRLYPNEGRSHYGWSMYPDGCCEACDNRMEELSYLPVITQAPSHDNVRKQMKTSVEELIVQRVLDRQAQTA